MILAHLFSTFISSRLFCLLSVFLARRSRLLVVGVEVGLERVGETRPDLGGEIVSIAGLQKENKQSLAHLLFLFLLYSAACG